MTKNNGNGSTCGMVRSGTNNLVFISSYALTFKKYIAFQLQTLSIEVANVVHSNSRMVPGNSVSKGVIMAYLD